VFEARVVGGEARPCAESLEVVPYRADAIPWDEIAFTTSWWGIRDWVSRRHPDVPLPDTFRGSETL